MTTTYNLLDSGAGQKLEQYGPHTIARPASQAIWKPTLSPERWEAADALFTRRGRFRWVKTIEGSWVAKILGLRFCLSLTDFGHLGLFPEQLDQWRWLCSRLKQQKNQEPIRVLNLFGYSGAATLLAAREGARVCHVDASSGMVAWARKNAALNQLESSPIRWIVDDAKKFVQREVRRKRRYDAIVVDPPSYGRGKKGEVFTLESDLFSLMALCRELLSERARFLLLSCHTANITSSCLQNLLLQTLNADPGRVECGELFLRGGKGVLPLPSGVFARWVA